MDHGEVAHLVGAVQAVDDLALLRLVQVQAHSKPCPCGITSGGSNWVMFGLCQSSFV